MRGRPATVPPGTAKDRSIWRRCLPIRREVSKHSFSFFVRAQRPLENPHQSPIAHESSSPPSPARRQDADDHGQDARAPDSRAAFARAPVTSHAAWR